MNLIVEHLDVKMENFVKYVRPYINASREVLQEPNTKLFLTPSGKPMSSYKVSVAMTTSWYDGSPMGKDATTKSATIFRKSAVCLINKQMPQLRSLMADKMKPLVSTADLFYKVNRFVADGALMVSTYNNLVNYIG